MSSSVAEAAAKERLHSSGEDYLKAIFILEAQHSSVRSVEVAEYMNVSKASVNITLQTLSTIACMSESKMKKLFKSVYNMSITEYIQRKRISVAEHMLIQTDLTIAEISRIVGYSNPSRLIEIFKRYYGFTPSKYRE